MRGARRSVVLFALMLAAVLMAPTATSAGGFFPRISTGDGTWVWQNPWPQGNTIRAGSVSNTMKRVALTDGGICLHEDDSASGAATTVPEMGLPVDLDMTSDTTGFAVSLPEDFSSAVWRTSDAGETWTRRALIPDTELASADFVDDSSAWAVGNDYGETWGAVVMRTEDGGSTWSKRPVTEDGYLYSVAFSSATNGWIGGYAPVGEDDSSSFLLHTADGSTWTTALVTYDSGNPAGDRGAGFDVICALDATTAWAAEDGNVYRTTDGGSTFATATIEGRPRAMGFADELNGWVLTDDWGSYYVQHTEDGGLTWDGQTLPAEVDGLELNDVSVVSSGTALVFGEGGIVLYTFDRGATWTLDGWGERFDLRGVAFGNAHIGWAVGEDRNDPAILRTSDGGGSWWKQTTTVPYRLTAVCASGTQEAWAVGLHGTILHTTDSGTTWGSQTTTLTTYLDAIDFAGTSGHGWAVGGNGAIIHTADGGGTWVSQGRSSGPELEAVSAIDATSCWAAGDEGAILVTGDGGSTWTTRSAGFPDDEYTGAHFLDADNGWLVGNDGSTWTGVMLRTRDGGRRWSRSEYPTAGFNAITFSDPMHGRAVSWTGTVLCTADGGDTWSVERTGAAGYLTGVASLDETHTWVVGAQGAILFARGGAASGCATLPGPAPLPYVAATVPVEGLNRFETAVEASQETFADGSASDVVLATGRNWPDALGGAALAKAVGGPILLCEKGSIPPVVSAEIARLGATRVYILGSRDAVSDDVVSALRAGGKTVTRIGGANRYETARMVADETIELLGAGYDGTAFAATGRKFPDSVAASPLAAAKGWPIYLFNPDLAPSSTIASMTAEGVTHVLILGNTDAVPEPTETSLAAEFGAGNVVRLGGDDRYETAAAIAAHGVGHAGLGWDGVGIATGTNFPDALAGGVMLGNAGSVLLLTPGTTLAPATQQTLTDHRDDIYTVYFLGGPTTVSPAVRTAVTNALR